MTDVFKDWKYNKRMIELCKKYKCIPDEILNSYVDNCKALKCYDTNLN